MASTFIPYQADLAWLEALYVIIDVCLLVGLIAIYLFSADHVGVLGLAAFLVALAGVASIVGPDAPAFGIDFYRIGALVFVAGLAGLSARLLRAGILRASASLWIATLLGGAGLICRAAGVSRVGSVPRRGICSGRGSHPPSRRHDRNRDLGVIVSRAQQTVLKSCGMAALRCSGACPFQSHKTAQSVRSLP